MNKFISSEILEHIALSKELESLNSHISDASKLIIDSIDSGGKVILFGNGGSAADAQHIAAELVGRYKIERRGLPAISLSTDTSAITSIGNDFGFEKIFERQLESLLNENDIVIGISTSGNSRNVLNAINYAVKRNIKSICLLGGNGGKLKDICMIPIVIPSSNTPRIQEMHIFIGHTICGIIDNYFSS